MRPKEVTPSKQVNLPANLNDEQVINERLAAKLAGLSYAYLRTLRMEGTGPRYVLFTPNRLGYRVKDVKMWLETKLQNKPQPPGLHKSQVNSSYVPKSRPLKAQFAAYPFGNGETK